MRFPDFLIIGAMKAGTTSLFHDLRAHPRIIMPREKEAGCLRDDDVLTEAGRRRYARLFAPARDDQVCGEAPTDYSKLPDITGVPLRARRIAGERLRAIYIVREPVARIISHHYHAYSAGQMPPSIDEAVRTRPELLNYTRYAMQITPWIDTLGIEQIRMIVFEEYVDDRAATIASLHRFLDVDPRPELVREDQVHNRSEGKPILRGPLVILRRNPFYERIIRPLLPLSARAALRRALLPTSPPRPDPPSLVTVDRIIEQLHDDQEQLRGLLQRPRPVWDLAAVRRRYETPPSSCQPA